MRHTKRHGTHLNNTVTIWEYNDDIVVNNDDNAVNNVDNAVFDYEGEVRSRAFAKFGRVKGLIVFGVRHQQ